MTSHFIPMLSSTPPPFEEGGSFEDEDDEFGDFTAAARTLNDDNSPVKKAPPQHNFSADSLDASQNKSQQQHHQSNGHVEALERSPTEECRKAGKFRPAPRIEEETGTTATCSDEDDPRVPPSKQEQRDDTSQESVTDSGHCSVSQHSETSPLPHIEGPGFLEAVELREEEEEEENISMAPEGVEIRCGMIAHDSSEVEDLHLGSYGVDSMSPESGEEEERRTACGSSRPPSVGDEDEFADFASAQFEDRGCGDRAVPPEEFPSGAEFADFERASFGDFSGALNEQSWATFEERSQEETQVERDLSQDASSTHTKIVQMLHAAFPLGGDDLQSTVPEKQLLGGDESPSNRLWRKLEDLDQSVSLQYHWNGSRAFQRLLYSLNIDSRNIEVIPPAQFDWSSSGLVNPLDQMQSSSSLLDLDFFVRSGSTPSQTVPPSSLEAEFLGPGDVPSPGSARPALLPQLLKLSKSTMLESSRRPSELSEAAVRILDGLPDLSFMRAKVLMFPVRCSLDSS